MRWLADELHMPERSEHAQACVNLPPAFSSHSWQAVSSEGTWRSPQQRTAFQEEGGLQGQLPETGSKLTHMVCGVSAGASGGSQISCGVPMYKDAATGAPYIMPLFTQPRVDRRGGAAAAAALTGPAAKAQLLEAAASAQIRSEAMSLLRGFLNSAPPAPAGASPSGFLGAAPASNIYYPIPSKPVPTGIEIVPDVGPVGAGTPAPEAPIAVSETKSEIGRAHV
eukprot:TRINITY_DN95280_c0_g1_i1.p1 TRINITY_DN95280_c0_g1~~TRINITY_DN95280_c0_g1_i1.p1  ORF type:complete len:224 (+),score=39.37 TRINITY_DN95280_c0_g1_i1:89-760(+)